MTVSCAMRLAPVIKNKVERVMILDAFIMHIIKLCIGDSIFYAKIVII